MTDRSATAHRPVILLVEDEPAVRRALQLVLQGSGFSVRSQASSAAALGDPLALQAAAIVADYRLPDGDGLNLLRGLRQRGFAGPAILITAYGSPDLAASAREAGYARILEKPLPDRVLREAVVALLADHR